MKSKDYEVFKEAVLEFERIVKQYGFDSSQANATIKKYKDVPQFSTWVFLSKIMHERIADHEAQVTKIKKMRKTLIYCIIGISIIVVLFKLIF